MKEGEKEKRVRSMKGQKQYRVERKRGGREKDRKVEHKRGRRQRRKYGREEEARSKKKDL